MKYVEKLLKSGMKKGQPHPVGKHFGVIFGHTVHSRVLFAEV